VRPDRVRLDLKLMSQARRNVRCLAGMLGTRVADQDNAISDWMSAVQGAGIYSMSLVEAATDRVAFDDAKAHVFVSVIEPRIWCVRASCWY